MLQGLVVCIYVLIHVERSTNSHSFSPKLSNPLKTGGSGLSMTAGMLPFSVVAGILMAHTGRCRLYQHFRKLAALCIVSIDGM